MKKTERILIGTILFFLVIGAGFAAGLYASKNNATVKTATVAPIAQDKKSPRPNHKTYRVSPPSIGADLTVISVKTVFKNGVAVVQLTAQEAAPIKTGQTALLYNDKGERLGVLGKVIKVFQPPENDASPVTITISAPNNDLYAEKTFTRAEIAVARNSEAVRLPATSIVEDKGRTMAWEIFENEDGTHSAYSLDINVLKRSDDYVVIQQVSSDSSNRFILDPDDRLEDDQKINIEKVLYTGPAQTPDIVIGKNTNRKVQEKLRKMSQDLAFRQPGGHSLSGTNQQAARQLSSAQCAQSQISTQAFIDNIRRATIPKPAQLISMPAAPPQTAPVRRGSAVGQNSVSAP